MWTASIVSIHKDKGRATIRVKFENGAETFEEEFSTSTGVDIKWLRDSVRSRMEGFKAAYTFADTLSPGMSVDLTPPQPPTQEETEREAFLEKYRLLVSANRAKEAGVITGQEPAYTQLVNDVKAAYKNAYLKYM